MTAAGTQTLAEAPAPPGGRLPPSRPVTASGGRLWGYLRASTAEQVAPGTSTLDDQARRIEGVAMIRGVAVTEVFTDAGVSGSIPLSRRPAGERLLAVAARGDIVVAAKMDRMFRSARDALATAEMLRGRGVSLVLADMGPEPITGNGVGKLFFTMLAAFAEFERERFAERRGDGRAAKAARGGHTGGHAPFGTKVLGSGRNAVLHEDASEQALLARIRALREAGMTVRAVADRLAEEGWTGRTGKPLSYQRVGVLLAGQP